jgi:hypothetical protein
MIVAMPRGVTSAPPRIGSGCDPSGHVGISTRSPLAASREASSPHRSPAMR